jgi:regulator of replication initiation timing
MPNTCCIRRNQTYFKLRKIRKEAYSLAVEEEDGKELKQLKEQIREVAKYGLPAAADNLEWVFNQLDCVYRNIVDDGREGLDLLEENHRLTMEAKVQLRRKAEFVLETANTAAEKQAAIAAVEDVNEWLALSVQYLDA